MRQLFWLAVLALMTLAPNALAVYDTRTGRFLQRDPIGYSDGMNQYRYEAATPVASVDPFGTSSSKVSNPYGWKLTWKTPDANGISATGLEYKIGQPGQVKLYWSAGGSNTWNLPHGKSATTTKIGRVHASYGIRSNGNDRLTMESYIYSTTFYQFFDTGTTDNGAPRFHANRSDRGFANPSVDFFCNKNGEVRPDFKSIRYSEKDITAASGVTTEHRSAINYIGLGAERSIHTSAGAGFELTTIPSERRANLHLQIDAIFSKEDSFSWSVGIGIGLSLPSASLNAKGSFNLSPVPGVQIGPTFSAAQTLSSVIERSQTYNYGYIEMKCSKVGSPCSSRPATPLP